MKLAKDSPAGVFADWFHIVIGLGSEKTGKILCRSWPSWVAKITHGTWTIALRVAASESLNASVP